MIMAEVRGGIGKGGRLTGFDHFDGVLDETKWE
jgi:hypothetical protein